MPGFEFFGAEEKKEVNEVLETGILMRYGFDGPRKGIWKSKELEQAICSRFGTQYAQLTSSSWISWRFSYGNPPTNNEQLADFSTPAHGLYLSLIEYPPFLKKIV